MSLTEEGSGKHPVLVTGESRDDYFSTLGKGFLGLKLMFEGKHKDKKWFIIMGDDVFLQTENLLTSLSAYDPEQVWYVGLSTEAEWGRRG